MKDIVKNERPYMKIRQNIIDLIYTLESFTAQELLSKTVNIEGDEKVKEDIVQDLLCNYRNLDLIMNEGRFYPQKRETVMPETLRAHNDVRNSLVEALQNWGIENTDSFPFESVADYLISEGFIKEFTGESEKITTPKDTYEMYKMFRKEIDQYTIPLIVDDFLEFVELIKVDGEIVGMCGGADGYIDCLYVLPKHRRQGYAKKLALDWYGRYGRGKNATRLHIVNNNIPALKFWNTVFELKEVDCSAVDTLYEIVKVRQ